MTCRPFALIVACFFMMTFGCSFAGAQGSDAPTFDSAFWDHWGDGSAEVAGYTLQFPRYGEIRKGSAVAIFVTETFSNRVRVKADPGNHPESDTFPVMKLNLVQDFSTGVYDYNLMTSAFVAIEKVNGHPAGALTKVGFSSQEWCGLLHSQYLFNQRDIDYTLHSYFDGEADQRESLPLDGEPFSEDALLLWARGFTLPTVAPGKSKTQPMLMGLQTARVEHKTPAWQRVTLSRSVETVTIEVPAGRFEAREATASVEGGRSWTFFVEAAHPHRIIRWATSDGQLAELTGSERMKYWQMNGNDSDRAVERIGLPVRPDDSM